MKNKTGKFARAGALAAIAFILQVIGSFMGIKVSGFLEIELSDFPAIVGAFALGPFWGVGIEFVKNLLHLSISSTGFVGEFANFVVNGVYVLALGLIYSQMKTKRGAVISLIIGGIVMVAAAVLTNLYIMLPLYMGGAPFEEKLKLVLTVITPFNTARATVLSVITLFSYKKLSPLLKK